MIAPLWAWYQIYWQTPVTDGELLIETVGYGSINKTIAATGKLEPKNYVEVGAQVSGQLEQILVEEGDQVEAGQLLVKIDASVFETRVNNAAASLENKQAQLQQLEAEVELAELRAKRNQGLYAQQAVSEDTLVASQTELKVLRARIRAMQAQIRADTAALEGDQVTLGFANIYAPITGTVVSVAVRQGQTINANQNAPILLKIANLDIMTLRAEVSEADVPSITRGMPVYFETFGSNGRRWHSEVRQILPTPNVVNDVVLYQVLVDIANEDRALMDAMTAQVFFNQGSADNVLVVPRAAVIETPRNTFARKMVDGEIQRTPVKLGLSTRTQVEITSGLNEGDQVVVGRQNAGNTRRGAQSGPPSGPPGRRP